MALVRAGRELGVPPVSIGEIQPASGASPALLAGSPVFVVLAKVGRTTLLRRCCSAQGWVR